jgi:ribosomal-protein-alanine N-acetyltransferase
MTIHTYNASEKPNLTQKNEISDFLFKHLERFGDDISAIKKCIDYAVKNETSFGGFILVIEKNKEIVGVTIVNETGMKEYIPENILVYIATHNDYRGQGIGKKMMQETIQKCNGNIALHVEADNPAKFLYEKMGFESKYLEMRLIKN